MGPFIQQAIQYHPCNQVQLDSNASVPRTSFYSPADLHVGAGSTTLNLPMKGVIFAGIMNPSGETGVPFTCPTGNCTFGSPYTSLEICSTCENAAYYMQNSCANVSIPAETFPNGTETFGHQFVCSSTAPNGLSVWQPPTGNDWSVMQTASNRTNFAKTTLSTSGFDFANFSLVAFTNSTCTTEWTSGGPKKPDTDCIVPTIAFNADELRKMADGELETTRFYNSMATECTLSYCLRTYNTSISDGVLHEEPIPVTMLPLMQNNLPSRLLEKNVVDFIAVPCYVNGVPLDVPQITQGTFDNGVSITFNNTNSTIPHECLYTIQIQDYEAMAGYFGLNGLTENNFFTGAGYATYVSEITPGYPYGFQPQWLQPIYSDAAANLSSVSKVFSDLAQAMTTHLRQSGNNSTRAQGIVWTNQTCVHVVWPWITVPAVLIVASFIFLTIVVTMSRSHARENAWKSSALALLFHGFDHETQQTFGPLHSGSNMTRAAKTIKVEFGPTNSGWKFVR
jgi:hypothetical protein